MKYRKRQKGVRKVSRRTLTRKGESLLVRSWVTNFVDIKRNPSG